MFFNSFEFLVFLPLVFFIYWGILKQHLQAQNLFILGVSYVFYAWWDWRFLFLIILSSLIDFLVGKQISKKNKLKHQKYFLGLSVFVNLGLLGVFKYYDFFIASFCEAFLEIGVNLNLTSLSIILPVGISFYTFQTMSYSIDIYRKRIEPAYNWISFFAFVSFFPQLVAGPIERASNLLPQFYKKRVFSQLQISHGLRQILWGLFKKIVIADTCANYVNYIFNHSTELSAISLILGAVFFAFQIYGDFSGYSDIALGTCRLLGFELMTNFKTPYFSRNIAEFWRRWHISLNTWFRDYVYIPLGGSQGGIVTKIRNIFIIFLVSGFWHGANWTYLIWGGLNAFYFLPLLLMNRNRKYLNELSEKSFIPSFREFLGMLTTFILITISWIFFRAETVNQAINYIENIYTLSYWFIDEQEFLAYAINNELSNFTLIFIFIIIMLLIEWIHRNEEYPFTLSKMPKIGRWILYNILLMVIVYWGTFEKTEFIYFQF